MEIEGMLSIIIGIIGVLLVILALSDFYGGEWAAVGNHTTLIVVPIGFFALVLAAAVYWRRK